MKDKRQQKIDSFIYPPKDEKAYVLGSERSAPFEILKEDGDWEEHLPETEVQRNDTVDTNGCTNFGSLNMVEVMMSFVFGKKVNYSERFTAVMSGQNRNGNDPHKVLESIRTDGVLDEDVLPFKSGMNFEEYLSPRPMTRGFVKEALGWLSDKVFKHDYLYDPDPDGKIPPKERKEIITNALKRSIVGGSFYAWQERDGVYIKPKKARDTHWAICYGVDKETGLAKVFDSYYPFKKLVEWNHFDVAKGIYLKYEPNKNSFIASIISSVISVIEQLMTKLAVYPIKKNLFIDRLSQGWGVRNPLYKSGIAAIDTIGITKLGLREGHDIEDVALAAGNRQVKFRGLTADQTGTANDPKLVVEHATSSEDNALSMCNF